MLQIKLKKKKDAMAIFYENTLTLFDPLREFLGSPEISILTVLFFLRISG